jgi:hypothetical protein
VAYQSDLGSNPLIIDDSNASRFVEQWRDEGRAFGMTPRDYSVAPFGSASRPAVDLSMGPILQRSQFADAIKRADEARCTPDDWRKAMEVPIENQGNWGYCHNDETEVLTDTGWKLFADVGGTDLLATVNPVSRAMEFQAPSARQVFDYDGQMLYNTNGRMRFGVTPNHRMYVRKWNEQKRTLNDHYEFTTAENLGWYAGAMAAPSHCVGVDVELMSLEGDRQYAGDDFVALVALVCSDGYAGNSEKSMGYVSFCCFAESRAKMVSELAARVGFGEQPGRDGVWTRYSAHALAKWVRKNCYTGEPSAKTKKVPQFIKELSPRQIEIFLRYFGDQDHAKPLSKFYSSSKRMIDDIQELLLCIGKRASIGAREPRTAVMKCGKEIRSGVAYSAYVYQSDKLSIEKKKQIERESYRGPVYCATVPNGTLVTRMADSVLISGNCWAHGTINAVEITYAMSGYKCPNLNPFPVAYRIKNGRNQGGWGEQALKGIAEFGIPEHSVWAGNKEGMSQWQSPEVIASANRHKVTASLELPQNNFAALVTSLTHPKFARPVTMGLNWWGHLVCAVRAVALPGGGFGILIVNSWGEGWGQNGCGVLVESKSIAFEQIRIERCTPILAA